MCSCSPLFLLLLIFNLVAVSISFLLTADMKSFIFVFVSSVFYLLF